MPTAGTTVWLCCRTCGKSLVRMSLDLGYLSVYACAQVSVHPCAQVCMRGTSECASRCTGECVCMCTFACCRGVFGAVVVVLSWPPLSPVFYLSMQERWDSPGKRGGWEQFPGKSSAGAGQLGCVGPALCPSLPSPSANHLWAFSLSGLQRVACVGSRRV